MAGVIGSSVSPLGTVGEAKRARTEENGAQEGSIGDDLFESNSEQERAYPKTSC